jgi:hypothetical protein
MKHLAFALLREGYHQSSKSPKAINTLKHPNSPVSLSSEHSPVWREGNIRDTRAVPHREHSQINLSFYNACF